MFNYVQTVNKLEVAVLPVNELVELLEYKLHVLKKAREEEPDWNYPIEELETQIAELRKL